MRFHYISIFRPNDVAYEAMLPLYRNSLTSQCYALYRITSGSLKGPERLFVKQLFI